MKLTRKYHVLHRDADVTETLSESYEQPLRDHVAYVTFYAFWWLTWHVKPLEWLIDHPLDRLVDWRHKRRCDGLCTTWRKPDGSSGKACVRMPLNARLDCKLFDLHHKRNSNVHRQPD